MAVLESFPADDAIEEILSRVEARAKTIFARFRIPAQDSEDVFQQTVLVYLMRESEIHDPEAWMIATLRQRCLMYWRSRRRQLYEAVDAVLLEAVPDGAPGAAEQALMRRDLRGALACISGRCRTLLGARYALGDEPAAAAARLGYKPSGVYKLLERCLSALTRVMIDRGLGPRRHA